MDEKFCLILHRKTISVQNMQNETEHGTKKSILDVARELFDRFGYEKTSMNDIAKRSHKAKGSLYYNFNGKIDIFKSLVEQEYADIKAKLIESCQLNSDPPITKDKVIKYLQMRMELFDKASMIRQTITAQYYEIGHDIITVAEDIRKDFDQWEWHFFHDVCNTGKQYQVLTSEIQPHAFADMLQMLLKAMEILFFAKNEYEKSKSTYESMIQFLISK